MAANHRSDDMKYEDAIDFLLSISPLYAWGAKGTKCRGCDAFSWDPDGIVHKDDCRWVAAKAAIRREDYDDQHPDEVNIREWDGD